MAKAKKPAGPKKGGVVEDGAGGYVGTPESGDKGSPEAAAGERYGGGKMDPPQNLSFPSWGEITDVLKKIKDALDLVVAVLGATKGRGQANDPNRPSAQRTPCGDSDIPACPDAAGDYMLVCNNGVKSWKLVGSAAFHDVSGPTDGGEEVGDDDNG